MHAVRLSRYYGFGSIPTPLRIARLRLLYFSSYSIRAAGALPISPKPWNLNPEPLAPQEKVQRPVGDGAIVYVRPEDEYFHKQAAWSCTFPVLNRAVGKDELRPLRLVMLVDASKARRPSITWVAREYQLVAHLWIVE